MPKIIVIGAGASGLMAACVAAENGASVTVLEQNNRIGRKLAATGNGKCNFTNAYMDVECYHGQAEFYQKIWNDFTVEDTLSFMKKLGVLPYARGNYYYPASEQASAVIYAFEQALKKMHVKVCLEEKVSGIFPVRKGTGYEIKTITGKVYEADSVIIATGLYASPQLGSGEDMVHLLESMGYDFTPVLPALCGFYCKGARFKEIAGVRVLGRVQLMEGMTLLQEDTGEIQFTEYGISGIPVFQISGAATRGLEEGKSLRARICFLPEYEREELEQLLGDKRRCNDGIITPQSLLNGLLPDKLAREVAQKCHISYEDPLPNEESVMTLLAMMQGFEVQLKRVREFQYAQVCAGGIGKNSVSAEDLSSLRHSGIFFCGEILDVDGICGGYNLQWAWTSGYVAGRNASKREA